MSKPELDKYNIWPRNLVEKKYKVEDNGNTQV